MQATSNTLSRRFAFMAFSRRGGGPAKPQQGTGILVPPLEPNSRARIGIAARGLGLLPLSIHRALLVVTWPRSGMGAGPPFSDPSQARWLTPRGGGIGRYLRFV